MAVEVRNAKEVIDRVAHLRYEHQQALVDRYRFKSIVNGGAAGIQELLGSKFLNANQTNDIPIPNLMASGLEKPHDWDLLSLEEKESRLNKALEQITKNK